MTGTKKIEVQRYSKDGSEINGFILNFCLDIRNNRINKPSNYSLKTVERIAADYEYNSIDSIQKKDDYPNIVVIMSEAFADFSVYGDRFSVSGDVLSNYHGIEDNVIKGYALSSVFGGKTANSEYEFLTGNTMAFLPYSSVPYNQYVKGEIWSLVSFFNALEYETVGMHPYYENGWNRNKVYPIYYGFDRTMFVNEFPQKNIVRSYVADEELYDVILQEIKNVKKGDKKFIFAVSMQNHSDYGLDNSNATYIDQSIDVYPSSKDYPGVKDYLSLLKISDRALGTLISSLSQIEEKTVLVLFGDHQPKLENGFYSEVLGEDDSLLGNKQLQYMVPFIIWANYDIDEQYIPCTSINFLPIYMFKASGIESPQYFKLLSDVMEVIPAMNANGYFSNIEKHFIPFANAEGEEYDALNRYHLIEYNSVFDKEKNRIFFPVYDNIL